MALTSRVLNRWIGFGGSGDRGGRIERRNSRRFLRWPSTQPSIARVSRDDKGWSITANRSGESLRGAREMEEEGRKEERKEGVKVRNRVQSCRTHVAEVLKDTG